AGVALRIAADRVAADADRVLPVRHGAVVAKARDLARAWQAGAGRAAAVARRVAGIAIDAAAFGRLADLHAGRRVDLAQRAAAVAARVARGAVDAGAAVGRAGRRLATDADRAARRDR